MNEDTRQAVQVWTSPILGGVQQVLRDADEEVPLTLSRESYLEVFLVLWSRLVIRI